MTTIKTFTRQDYLNRKCTHSEYYRQFVTDSMKDAILNRFTKDELTSSFANDENLNNIPLASWDSLAHNFKYQIDKEMRLLNDSFSLAGGCCTMKEAAKQIINS